MNQRAELNFSENWVLTDAISESGDGRNEGQSLGTAVDAARKRTRRFEVLESFVDAPLELCPLGELVLSTGGHQLRLSGPRRRFEFMLAGDQLGVEETQIQ